MRTWRRRHTVLAALATVVAAGVLILATFDWNRARPWIATRLGNAIERPVAIQGDLTLHWQRPAATMPPQARTLLDHVPRPWLVARDVVIDNPATMPRGPFATIGSVTFTLEPIALLQRTLRIPVLRFDTPQVQLKRLDAARNNWQFPRQDGNGRWRVDLQRIVLTDGTITLEDAVTRSKMLARLHTLENDPRYGVAFTLEGSYNGAPVHGQGRLGAVLSLRQQSTPYPVAGQFSSGRTRIAAEGTITRPTQLAALDLKLTLAGASMARLYEFTGIVLPETRAFTTSGRLRGELGEQRSQWVYEQFTGKVGESDLAGSVTYTRAAPRPRLTGEVRSRKLVFTDLAPLIGADSNASKQARGVDATQPAGRVLPTEQFKPERWTALDADVTFTADDIVRDKALPISKLSTHLQLADGLLTLDPLTFRLGGGTVNSTIRLDGRARSGKRAIDAEARISARSIRIRELFPTIEQMQASAGHIDGNAHLKASGNSVAEMLANANGDLRAMADQGQVSKMLLEMAGLNIANIVITQLFGDKPVTLNCVVADFGVTQGIARTRNVFVDTEEAVIEVSGAINLAAEQLDLRIDPHTRSLRVLSLRSPLYLRGPLRKPDVQVDKGALALKAGSALTLGALAAPIAALLPLIHTGPGPSSDCTRVAGQGTAAPRQPGPSGKPATGSRADGKPG